MRVQVGFERLLTVEKRARGDRCPAEDSCGRRHVHREGAVFTSRPGSVLGSVEGRRLLAIGPSSTRLFFLPFQT